MQKWVKVEISTRSVGRTKVLHILDIDKVTTQVKLEEAITMSGPDGDFKILSMRPAREDTQNASVVVKEEVADEILEKGNVKIGWLKCRVRERVHIPRCYKCQELGHLKSEFNGPDRKNECLKCGEPSHNLMRVPEYGQDILSEL